jgi:hypothetical protein
MFRVVPPGFVGLKRLTVPVALSTTLISAPGTAAADSSVTCPAIVPENVILCEAANNGRQTE